MEVLSGLNLEEIQKITDELQASKFRARQIHNWIYLKSVNSIELILSANKLAQKTTGSGIF